MSRSDASSRGISQHAFDSAFTTVFTVLSLAMYTAPVTVLYAVLLDPTASSYLLALVVTAWSVYVAQWSLRADHEAPASDSVGEARLDRYANVAYHNVMVGGALVVGAVLMSVTVPDVGVLTAMLAPVLHHEYARRNDWQTPVTAGISVLVTELLRRSRQSPGVVGTASTGPSLGEWGSIPSFDAYVRRYARRRIGN